MEHSSRKLRAESAHLDLVTRVVSGHSSRPLYRASKVPRPWSLPTGFHCEREREVGRSDDQPQELAAGAQQGRLSSNRGAAATAAQQGRRSSSRGTAAGGAQQQLTLDLG